MFELINDLTLYDIPSLNGEVNSLLLTSEDNESCSLVYKILNCVFSNHVLIFKASGMADEINVLKSYFNNSNLHYFEGDLSKMMIKKFPEFFVVIDNFHTLKHLLNDWVCTIYERRFIYVSSVDKYGNLLKEMKKNIFNYSNYLADVWPFIDGVFENLPDAPNHNTFIFSSRKNTMNTVGNFLSLSK